jgi:uncharacterized protein (DUF433 family)
MDWHGIIVCDPKILVGKPTVKGTRISVELILEHLAAGESEETILREFPRLKETDIRAALAFAADNVRRLSQRERRTAKASA